MTTQNGPAAEVGPLRRVGDEALYLRYEAFGVPRQEADRVYTESGGSISKVLIRLTQAEDDFYESRRHGGGGFGDHSRPVAEDESVGVGSTAWRVERGPSVVLSVRLDQRESAVLRRRAREEGVGTSVLARAFIRRGLGPLDALEALPMYRGG